MVVWRAPSQAWLLDTAVVVREICLRWYVAAFRTVNFEVCADASVEAGVEKIAIYTLSGLPKHAVRQLPNGNWASKLGAYEDIQHINLQCVSGPLCMERPVSI